MSILLPIIVTVIVFITSLLSLHVVFIGICTVLKINKLYIWKDYFLCDSFWFFDPRERLNMKNVKIVKNKAFVGESKLSFLSGRHYNNFIKTYAGKTIKFNGILYCVNIVKLDYEVEEFYFEPL